MIDFNDSNFDRDSFFNVRGVEGLENISNFIDFGIRSTIFKQINGINEDLENRYAKQILTNFMKGESKAFTSSNGIRASIITIDKFKIDTIMIKSMIDRHAFNVERLHKLSFTEKTDKIAKMISEFVADGNLVDVLNWINSDQGIMKILIDNYVDIAYQKDLELKEAYAYMTHRNDITNKAMEQLNLELSLNNIKSK